jgi:hypothetical protein
MKEQHISLPLEAKTKEELVSLQLRTRTAYKGMTLGFHSFYQQKDGKHVCWYDIPLAFYLENTNRKPKGE